MSGSSIDDRIVSLKFDNKQFEAASRESMSTLDKLKKSLDFSSSKKSMDGLQASARGFNLGNLATTVEGASNKFLALATIGVTALSNITNKAIDTGIAVVKALTIDPISTGLREYETNLNSIQTILSNTQAAGTTLEDVNGALAQLNEYSDKTIYNFSEMARNIGTFTAAGVGLKKSTAAIKGIANLAALSGSNSQQAATAMYQLSQAISAGTVKLIDWNSVVNAGMGGTVFQRALANTAVQMGKLDESTVKLTGKMKTVTIAGLKFRDSLSSGANADWLTSDVLTKTLAQFTGDLTDAELAAEGFSKKQIKAIQLQAKAAQDAATQVKTLGQVFDVAKETAGSGWAKTWQLIFGDFKTAKKDFTALSEAVNGVINRAAEARNALVEAWAKSGGRVAGIDALKNAFKALMSVITPIKEAWKAVFPPTTGEQLKDLTVTIRNFFKALILGPEQMGMVKRAFTGIFSVLDIGKQIIGGVLGFFKGLFGLFSSGGAAAAGGLLSVAASVGDMITNFAKFLKNSGAITNFFDDLLVRITPVVDFLKDVGNSIGGALGKIPEMFKGIGDSADGANEQLTPLQQTFQFLKEVWDKFVNALKQGADFIGAIGQAIKDAFTGTGDTVGGLFSRIQEAVSNINWTTIFKVAVGGGLIAVIGTTIRAMWAAITLFLSRPAKLLDAVKDIAKSVLGVTDQLKETLKTYQNQLKYKSLLLIAGSILMLAIALKLLSTIPVEQLLPAVLAMAASFKILMMTMETVNGMNAKIVQASAAMILIAVAVNLLATAVLAFGNMDPETIAQGLLTIIVALAGITAAMALMPDNANMAKNGVAILLIAVAVNALALAVLAFGNMDIATIIQGVGTIVVMIGLLGGVMNAMPKSAKTLAAAGALILMAVAINMLIIPIKLLGSMDPDQLVQGMLAMIVSIAGLVAVLNLVKGPGVIAGAAAIIVVSGALYILAKTLEIINAIGFGSVLVAIAGLVIALSAIALVAMTFAAAIPFIYALGVAIAILGGGFALFGLGALAFAAAFSIVLGLMTLGLPVLADAINNFIDIIPLLAKAFAVGVIAFAGAFISAMPAIGDAIFAFFETILNTFQKLIPKVFETLGLFLDKFLAFIRKYIPKIVETGWAIVDGVLKGIKKHLPDIIESGGDIIVELIKGIGKQALKIATAAGDTIIEFLEGMSKWIRENSQRFNDAAFELVDAIIDGLIQGVTDLGGKFTDAIGNLAGSAIEKAKEILHINSPSKVFIEIGKSIVEGFVTGVVGGKQDIIDSMATITEAIGEARIDATAEVKQLKKDLKDLKKAEEEDPSKKNKKAVAKKKAELKAAEAEEKRLRAAYTTITTERKALKNELVKLGGQYDVVTEKLDAAQKKYEDAVKQRDDYNKSITDKYSVLPTIDAETSLDSYFDTIRKATAANIKFKETLNKLRALGLDDTSYKKFLEQGTDAQPFLDSLLSAGGDAVSQLNAIDSSLADSASSLGKTASEALYQAGVDSAKGLVDGLTAQLKTITDRMKVIGKAIADELKKELGIKSPSKVFKEIGKFTVEGLAEGLDKNSNVIDISAKRLGKTAIDGLKDSMRGLTDVISDDVNLSPVIAPVLDLDEFRKKAAGIDGILAPNGVVPVTSSLVANDISAKTAQKIKDDLMRTAEGGYTKVELTQINQSPKSLSTAEIYRRTNNQLSTAREALRSNAN